MRRSRRRGEVVTVLALGAALVVFWSAVAFGSATAPGGPQWLTALAAAAAAVSAAAAASAAQLLCRRRPYVPMRMPAPVRQVRPRLADPNDWQTLQFPRRAGLHAWRSPAPDRPSAERPTPSVERYQCPVRPGWPRTVADLRDLDRRRRATGDLQSWE